MELIINGDRREMAEDTTVATVVRDLTAPEGGEVPGGIAVAVNDEVLRRTAWANTTLGAGDRVDVLTAVQGG
ncbi:thiamine biosynthesis protein ThiS [Nocardiopsis sp. CNR-923]|uniref:sulfur carrier protein ThiS n=1 Tax=Nocardiopsis sp. CNR-923 TaxID=1904965 RepID=UPI000960C2A3|nr:sulfur carrier protein ThiS [Nocardiopsis sp. CNR-923]OLT30131.1 thiamine biosynthesis protein ThiS [Nocardiopsis sp. CNR-923]